MGKREESLREFVSEAEEIIDDINQKLLEMESVEDRSTIRPDLVNTIFRGAHSLKGMSSMVGLKKVSEISHRLEDILDKLRMGQLGFTDKVATSLFKGIEVIQLLIRQVSSTKGEETNIKPVLQQIEQAMTTDEEAPAAEGLENLGFDPELTKVLTEYETHRLMENIKSGSHLFEVKADFKLDTFDKDLAKLNSKLQLVGEIITTLPTSGMSKQDGIAFNLILGTKRNKQDLMGQLKGETAEVSEMVVKSSKQASDKGSEQLPSEQIAESSIRSVTQTVRVDIRKLDELLNIVGELVVTKGIIGEIAKTVMQESGLAALGLELQKASQALDRKLEGFQEGLVEVRMIPIGLIFDRLVRIVRKLSRELGKEVDLQISGEETKLDKSMIEEIADPLMHLIRNSLDHGIESKEDRKKAGKPEVGIINLRAMQKGNNVVVEVEDNGSGIDLSRVYQKGLERGILEKDKEYDRQQILNVLFNPGFSTAESVTEISGRGVGLDVVAKNITKLSGMVDIETEEGQGTKFTITLPITMVIIKALIVHVGPETFAIPLNSVSESLMVPTRDIRTIEGKEVTQLRGRTLPLLRLRDIFQLQGDQRADRLYIVVVGLAEKRLGLVVDSIKGQQEIVIKPLGEILKNTPGIAGATELGNRKTILVLDIGALVEEASLAPSTFAGRA
jgi:two-component system, chemotaxis family, sensor kinase CheA